jgi:hypothetical protein
MLNQRARPVRNSSRPFGTLRAVRTVEWLETEGCIVSNGVNGSGLFLERMIKSIPLSMETEDYPFI